MIPRSINPIKQEIEELETMETKLWVRHTKAARALIDAGKQHASMEIRYIFSPTDPRFANNLQALSATCKGRRQVKKID